MSDFINDKIIPPVMAFINTPVMQALKDGLLYSMPMMIVGSVFLLLQQFPWSPVQTFLTNIGMYDIFGVTYNNTFSIMALVASVGIGYTYVKNAGYEGLPAGVISLSCWLMSQPQTITSGDTEVSGVIVRDWLAGKGMIAALLIGIIVGVIYTWFMKKNITIKMPAGVPQGVANAFTALIPAAVIVVVMTLLVYVVEIATGGSVLELIYTVIQSPLQGVTDNLGGVFIYTFLVSFFWWFGIHGATIMSGILGSIITANYAENEQIYQAGLKSDPNFTLTSSTEGVHVFTQQIIDQFCTVTGSGLTLGLVVYMLFFAKSEQIKSIGKLGIGPGIFNINEPVLFGTPIVLNPMLAIPFIAAPVLSGCLTYLLCDWGILPIFRGITVPWTTPPVLSGLLIGGVRGMIWQIIVIVGSFFIYFPFIKAYDNQCYKEEQENAAA
jgi:PTS system cellobiose-specific IIC component